MRVFELGSRDPAGEADGSAVPFGRRKPQMSVSRRLRSTPPVALKRRASSNAQLGLPVIAGFERAVFWLPPVDTFGACCATNAVTLPEAALLYVEG